MRPWISGSLEGAPEVSVGEAHFLSQVSLFGKKEGGQCGRLQPGLNSVSLD